MILITGARQSNYVRCAAAAAAKLGLRCVVQLEDRVKDMPAPYQQSGNVLLDHLLGAQVHTYPEGEDEAGADRSLEHLAEQLAARGERPYVIHLAPGHAPLGALGYVEAAGEFMRQATEIGVDFGSLVVASGSGQTHAGLLVGLRALGRHDVRVRGVCVRRGAAAQRARVLECAQATAALLGLRDLITPDDIEVSDDQLGPGYGRHSPGSGAAIRLAARLEGILIDPVYTGKALAGLITLARSGSLGDRATAFVHTGGTPALFAYGPPDDTPPNSPPEGRTASEPKG